MATCASCGKKLKSDRARTCGQKCRSRLYRKSHREKAAQDVTGLIEQIKKNYPAAIGASAEAFINQHNNVCGMDAIKLVLVVAEEVKKDQQTRFRAYIEKLKAEQSAQKQTA